MASTGNNRQTIQCYFKNKDTNVLTNTTKEMDSKTSVSEVHVERMNEHNKLKSCQNHTKKSNKDKSVSMGKKKRRTLQTLQPSAKTPNALVGTHRTINQVIKKGKRKYEDSEIIESPSKAIKREKIITQSEVPVTIYEDEQAPRDTPFSQTSAENNSNSKCVEDRTIQSTNSVETSSLSTKESKNANEDDTETIDQEAYDLMVAKDIPESYWKEVAEQRRIALELTLKENEELHQEVKTLKEENAALSEMASQAEYFANMLKVLTNDELEDKTTGSDSGNADSEETNDCEVNKDSNHDNTSANEHTAT